MTQDAVDERVLSGIAPGKTTGLSQIQALLVLAAGLAFSLEVIFGLVPLNPYVHWRNLGLVTAVAALLGPLLVIGWVVWRIERAEHAKWLLLGLLAASNFLLQVFGILIDPRGAGLIRRIVLSPDATSYFTDALQIDGISAWLSHYHQAALGGVHAAYHPAGPIVFCWIFIRLFGPAAGAWVCGCALGLAGAAGVPVIHKFAGLWTADPKARLLASAIYALIPALVVYFPEFDQGYAVLSMLLILLWLRSLGMAGSGDRLKYAVLLGTVLFAASFLAYQILSIGVFLAFYGLYWLWRAGLRLAAARKFLYAAGTAFGVWAGIYAVLWMVTGYNAPASFIHAVDETRRYVGSVPDSTPAFRLYVFAVGLGVMVVPIFLLHAGRLFDRFQRDPEDIPLTLITLGSLLAINLTGLFSGETDRNWLFLAPLIAVPAAIELARLSWRWRLLVFAMQGWILVCMRAKISFIEP